MGLQILKLCVAHIFQHVWQKLWSHGTLILARGGISSSQMPHCKKMTISLSPSLSLSLSLSFSLPPSLCSPYAPLVMCRDLSPVIPPLCLYLPSHRHLHGRLSRHQRPAPQTNLQCKPMLNHFSLGAYNMHMSCNTQCSNMMLYWCVKK